MKYLVYGLVDPRTRMVHYVGKTSTGMLRPRQHGVSSRIPRIAEWMLELRSLGMHHEIVVLELPTPAAGSCPRCGAFAALDAAEKWWIAFGRAFGWPLVNQTDGTKGGKRSPESRARMSAAHRGRRHTPESREKIAAAARRQNAAQRARRELEKR